MDLAKGQKVVVDIVDRYGGNTYEGVVVNPNAVDGLNRRRVEVRVNMPSGERTFAAWPKRVRPA